MKTKNTYNVISLNAILIIAAFVIFAFLKSCNDEDVFDCFKNTGEIVVIDVEVGRLFNSIYLYDDIDMIIYPDTVIKLYLEGGENLLPSVGLNFYDSILEIRNFNFCNWVRPFDNKIILHVHLPEFRYFKYNGSGTVQFADTLKQDVFEMDLYKGTGYVYTLMDTKRMRAHLYDGVADVVFRGKTDFLDVWSGFSGVFNSIDLEANKVYAQSSTRNHMYIWAVEEIKVRFWSSGIIYYKGNPTTEVLSNDGGGQLLPLP
jgi:hypothetical protein